MFRNTKGNRRFWIFGFSIKKEISDRLKNTFPIFRTCCGTICFCCRKEKTTAVRVYRLSVVFSNLL